MSAASASGLQASSRPCDLFFLLYPQPDYALWHPMLFRQFLALVKIGLVQDREYQLLYQSLYSINGSLFY